MKRIERQATKEEAKRYGERAAEWWRVSGVRHFTDVRTASVGAVAEYAANLDGLTLYEFREGVWKG